MSTASPESVYEDSSVLVINKPSGWVTNSADTAQNVPIVQKWLYETQTYEIAKNNELRSGIVHRLDRETSGILIIAKTPKAFEDLQKQFKDRVIEKEYIALCHGIFKSKQGEIKATIGRLPWNRERFGIFPGGRESHTVYKVKGEYKNESETYSLVELFPKTGRTHQLRVHLKYLGNAIVSDPFYAGRKTSRKDRLWCPRLFLHAFEIKFIHPESKKTIKCKAELPEDLKTALSTLTKIPLH